MVLFRRAIIRTALAALAFALLSVPGHATTQAHEATAQTAGMYTLRADRPQQVIRGLGFEIQSDSIGSGNYGMPSQVIAVPHDLTPAERLRFYHDMLHGLRYSRLAMGLYLRGLDASQQHILERYPGEMIDLRTMQRQSGIKGFDVEYWSPAPYWKSTKAYEGGTIASTDPAFIDHFTDALVTDIRYLSAHGLNVVMWGLQNEPIIGKVPTIATRWISSGAIQQSYSACYYTPQDYYAVLKVAAPKIRAELPNVQIHVDSQDGPSGPIAYLVRNDPALSRNVDAWTWHQIGQDSDEQIELREKLLAHSAGKPVYQNEFEYQPDSGTKVESYFMNTGQSLMNWLVFENSPTWFWLHALKPVTNMEARGYALGFWRPAGELKANFDPSIQPGHWKYNPNTWNALAGFLRYLPWDSTRLTVDEDAVRGDQRILAWRDRNGRIGIALSNRGARPFTFHLKNARPLTLHGHRYTVTRLNQPLRIVTGTDDIAVTVPPQSFEFWMGK
ncbi:MAG: hypothetical protein ACYCOX_07620 [Acidobacteriaceae bacterium]